MKKLMLLGVLALLVGVTATYASSATLESATGHGTLAATSESGKAVKRQFSFTARRHSDGTVKGQAVLINPAFSGSPDSPAPYRLHIDITCMHVVGNIAVFGGTTKRTNDPNLVDAVFFSVQDNGEPGQGRDRISRVFFWDDDPDTTGDPQACLLTGPAAFPLEPIESGNIQVRPTGL